MEQLEYLAVSARSPGLGFRVKNGESNAEENGNRAALGVI